MVMRSGYWKENWLVFSFFHCYSCQEKRKEWTYVVFADLQKLFGIAEEIVYLLKRKRERVCVFKKKNVDVTAGEGEKFLQKSY
jgi:hypothetical protein